MNCYHSGRRGQRRAVALEDKARDMHHCQIAELPLFIAASIRSPDGGEIQRLLYDRYEEDNDAGSEITLHCRKRPERKASDMEIVEIASGRQRWRDAIGSPNNNVSPEADHTYVLIDCPPSLDLANSSKADRS
jgi:hypothetical protein